MILRWRICPDEGPDMHISYIKSLCDILLRIIDKVDPSIAHFVLFHEDIRTNNIITRVVGIIDWEGSRVLPMSWWSCFQESEVAS